MLTSGVHDGERRQGAEQVRQQVHLGERLASAVLCPVHAVGHQLDDRGVHRMDPNLEAPQQALAIAVRSQIRTDVLEVATRTRRVSQQTPRCTPCCNEEPVH